MGILYDCTEKSKDQTLPRGNNGSLDPLLLAIPSTYNYIIEGSLNRNFRQYGELKSSSRVIKSVDRRCNSQKVRRKKISPRQMLEKSRNAVFFHRFVCRVSPKVGLLKRRVRR